MRFIDDVLVVAGAGAIVIGVSLVNIPAAWIVAGVLCIAGGIVYGLAQRSGGVK
jgi:1,4-dihydroxy-2-naphthoate octaprenyltransferase